MYKYFMDKEQKSHLNIGSEVDLLKRREMLLEQAKNGNQEALRELQESASAKVAPKPKEEILSSNDVSVVSQDLRPNSEGISEAVKAEDTAITHEMLTNMIHGNLDMTDLNAVNKALIEATKKRMDQSRN